MTAADRRRQAQAILDAVARRDFDALAGLGFHDDVEFHSIISTHEGTHYRGIAGMREWAASIDAMYGDFAYEVVEMVPAPGECLVVVTRVTGVARVSGVPLDVRVAQVWEWRDGELWRNRSFSNIEDAYRVAGLGETQP